LLQWGNKDVYVLQDQIKNIYENIPGKNKRFVIYEDAGHQSLLRFDPLKWKEEVNAMLNDPESIRP